MMVNVHKGKENEVRPMKLYKHGGSVGLVIPAAICRAKALRAGSWVIVGLRKDGSVSVEKMNTGEVSRNGVVEEPLS